MNQMRNFFGGGNGGFNFGGRFGNIINNAGRVIGMFRTFMQNPIGAMLNSGMDIPQNIQGNPEAITNYLRASGRMNDDQYNQASQLASWAQNLFGKRF